MKMVEAEVAHQIGINVPGLALVIVQHGEIVHPQAWGDSDISSGARMTPDTACNLPVSHGSDDPTRAAIPFVGAIGAIDAGHDPELVLLGEATYLMKDLVSDQIDGVGWPPLRDLWPKIIEHDVPVYV